VPFVKGIPRNLTLFNCKLFLKQKKIKDFSMLQAVKTDLCVRKGLHIFQGGVIIKLYVSVDTCSAAK